MTQVFTRRHVTMAALAAFTGRRRIGYAADVHAAAATPTPAYPVTVTSFGQTSTFDRAPERVIVTYPTLVDTLVDLGLGDRIIGIAQTASGTLHPADQGAQYPSLSDGVATKEVVIAAQPDLVFADGDYNFDPQSGCPTYDELRQNGTATYTSYAGGSDRRATGTVQDLLVDIENLGKIFNVPERATALMATITANLDDIARRIAGRPRPTTAYLGFYDKDAYAYAGGIYKDLVLLGGGETVFSDITDTYATISSEALLARNPDALVLSYSLPSEQEAKLALAREDFPGIGAVVHDRIILAEEGATCPGSTRQVAVLHTIASGLHPGAFEDDATPETT